MQEVTALVCGRPQIERQLLQICQGLTSDPFFAPSSRPQGASTVQYFPLELPGRFPKLAAHEWLLLVNGEVRYTPQYRPLERLLSGYH